MATIVISTNSAEAILADTKPVANSKSRAESDFLMIFSFCEYQENTIKFGVIKKQSILSDISSDWQEVFSFTQKEEKALVCSQLKSLEN